MTAVHKVGRSLLTMRDKTHRRYVRYGYVRIFGNFAKRFRDDRTAALEYALEEIL